MTLQKKTSNQQNAKALGAAYVFQAGLRFLVPILLVRILSKEDFGSYQFFWLIANTVILVATLGLPRSLLYFIPRAEPEQKSAYVTQTFLLLLLTGFITALLVSPVNIFLPESITDLCEPQLILPAFIFLWILTQLLDFLANSNLESRWQAKAIAGLALVRNTAVITSALYTNSLQAIFWVLLLFVLLRFLLLCYYISSRFKNIFHPPKKRTITDQLKFSLPFAASDIFSQLRSKGEMWMIAILLSKDSFAVFSVVTNLFQVISIIRNSLAQVVTPAMSKTESMGDAERTLKINNNANIAACVIIFPICCFLFLFAHEIITLLFTSNYSDAAPVLRIYIFALILSGIDLSSFLVILKKGPFVLKTNVVFGAFSLIISYIGIHALGMPGVAIGSVMTLFLVKCLNIYVVSKEIKVSIKQLQPWKVFTQLLLSSLISSVLTYLISHYYPPQFSHYILLPLSGLLFGLIYLLCLKAFGLEWIIKWFLKTK